jgi:hypothetical protein
MSNDRAAGRAGQCCRAIGACELRAGSWVGRCLRDESSADADPSHVALPPPSVGTDPPVDDEGDPMTGTTTLTRERADLIESLRRHRAFLRFTVRDLTDEQALRRPTASALNLAGLIKHVASTEAGWVRFAEGGAEAMHRNWGPDASTRHWHLAPGETLAGVLSDYEAVGRHTDELVATLPDLDVEHALPEAPWFEAGARWSARRVFLHVIAETAQHAGHADILRESIDGQKTMG